MNKLLVFISGGIIILFVGFYIGMLAQAQKDSTQIKALSNVQSLLNSKVLVPGSSLFAYGTVSKIEGKTITLSSLTPEKSSLEIPLNEEVTVSFVNNSENSSGMSEGADLQTIKVGDRAGVDIKINPNGQFEGISVKVLSY